MPQTSIVEPIRVVIADTQEIYRLGFEHVVERNAAVVVVGQAESQGETLDILRSRRPDILVIDSRLNGGFEETVQATLAEQTASGVIVLAANPNDRELLAAFNAGAKAYVSKRISTDAIIDAIANVHDGATYVDGVYGPLQLPDGLNDPRASFANLTRREREVFAQLAAGKTNREIAESFGVAEGTVKTHVGNILSKLGVRSRAQAAAMAAQFGSDNSLT